MTKYPFIGAVLGSMGGICIGFYGSSLLTASLIFILAATLVLSLQIRPRIFLIIFIVFFILAAFYTHHEITQIKEHQNRLYRFVNEVDRSWKGTVISELRTRKGLRGPQTSFVLELISKEKVLVQMYGEVNVFYGDMIELRGRLSKANHFSNDSNFSYPDYLLAQGIVYILHVGKSELKLLEHQRKNWLVYYSLKYRERLKIIYDRYLTIKESALMKAFVLGDRTAIPGRFKQMFVETGTAHILAISGLNVGIVVYLLLIVLKTIPIPRKCQIIVTIVMIIFYAFLTGLSPSVVRATIMAVILLFGLILERETHSLNSLALAALIILGLNPLNLFDIGFQLSFICVFAIIEFYPLVSRFWEKDTSKTILGWLKKYFITSFGLSVIVWIWVAGWIVYYFKILTPVTILANLIVVPLSSLIVALGVGLLVSGLFVPILAVYFGVCLKLALNFLLVVTFVFQNAPLAFFYTPRINLLGMICYYGLVGLLFWQVGRRYKQGLNLKSPYNFGG